MKKFAVCLGALGLCAGLATAKDLVKQTNGIQLTPVRIAQVYADGSIGQWQDYVQTRDILSDTLVFDNFEPDVDGSVSGTVGFPIGGGTCGLGSPEDADSGRWFFGTTYNNPFAANDMTAASGGGSDINDMVVAWNFGAGADRGMFLVISTFDSNAIADNTGLCDTPVNQDDASFLGGVILDFGFDPGSSAGYYFTVVEDLSTVSGISVPVPADLIGAYHVIIGTYVTDPATDGVLDTTPGSQPMLWGTGDAEAIGGAADGDRPGTQNEWQWDDDFVIDGVHQAPDECYNYAFGVCPDPLGAMIAFWVAGGCPCVFDLDDDCRTGLSDLILLFAEYGTTYDFQDFVGLLDEYGCEG